MTARRLLLLGAATVAVVLLAGCDSSPSSAPASSGSPAGGSGSPSSSVSAPTSSTPPTPAPPSRAQVVAGIRKKFDAIADDQPKGSMSAAVTDLAGKTVYSFGAKKGMRTASVYKLLVLETLLRKSKGPLSGSRADRAARAIEHSENYPAYSLYLEFGGCPVLKKTVRLLKMTHTKVGCGDPTDTETSGADLMAPLRALEEPGLLTASARKYALGLLNNVEKDQRWGVGVAADPKGDFINKNGWLDFDADNGRWAVTSVGVVQVKRQKLLMAVFTQHQPDFGTGVKLNEKLARLVAPAAEVIGG